MNELDKLRTIEREIEQQWWWLNGALHAVAQVRSGDVRSFREMQAQKLAVDRKRVEIAERIAVLVGGSMRPSAVANRLVAPHDLATIIWCGNVLSTHRCDRGFFHAVARG